MDEEILDAGLGPVEAVVRVRPSASSANSRDESVPDERSQSPSVSEGSWVAEAGCLGSRCCDPRQTPYRFLGLVFMCFLGFGSYFCYDTPASLQNEIKEDMGVSTLQFSTLYSLYSWPNVVLCFVGGFLIDRVFGIRMGTLIFSTIVTMGQFVYAFGALIDAYWVMQLGRFIFGVGGESLAVAQNAYTVSWFKGKELNTVFGLQLSMARIGSTVNFLVMEPIYNWVDGMEDGHTTLGIALIIAGATCVFSLICAVVIAILDRRRSKLLHLSSTQVGEKIQLRDIGGFPLSFWLLCVICVAYYSAIFPFIGLSKVFFMYKYDMKSSAANTVSSIVYIISAVASPVFGFLVDKTGRNIMWVAVAISVTLGAHSMLAFSFINPYVAMSIMGLSYSLLASSLWPMVALIVPESQLGTAYGIMQSIQNLGLALISMLSGFVVDQYGYLMLEVLNLICVSIGLGCSFVVMLTDSTRDGGYLMKAAKGRPKEAPCVKRMQERAKQRNKAVVVIEPLVVLNVASGSAQNVDDKEKGADQNNFSKADESLFKAEVKGGLMNAAFETDEKQTSTPNEEVEKGVDSPAPSEDGSAKQEHESPVLKEDADLAPERNVDSGNQEDNTAVAKEKDISVPKKDDAPEQDDAELKKDDDSTSNNEATTLTKKHVPTEPKEDDVAVAPKNDYAASSDDSSKVKDEHKDDPDGLKEEE